MPVVWTRSRCPNLHDFQANCTTFSEAAMAAAHFDTPTMLTDCSPEFQVRVETHVTNADRIRGYLQATGDSEE